MDCDKNDSTILIKTSVQPAPGSYASVLKGREKDRMSGNKINNQSRLVILIFFIFCFPFFSIF